MVFGKCCRFAHKHEETTKQQWYLIIQTILSPWVPDAYGARQLQPSSLNALKTNKTSLVSGPRVGLSDTVGGHPKASKSTAQARGKVGQQGSNHAHSDHPPSLGSSLGVPGGSLREKREIWRKQPAKKHTLVTLRGRRVNGVRGFFMPLGYAQALQHAGFRSWLQELKDLLPYGFAIHHAGLPRTDRKLIEDSHGGAE